MILILPKYIPAVKAKQWGAGESETKVLLSSTNLLDRVAPNLKQAEHEIQLQEIPLISAQAPLIQQAKIMICLQ